MTTLVALIIFSMVVVLVFGYRQFNQWTDSEAKNTNSDSELLAYAPPKSFTSFGRFTLVAMFYCVTLLVFYGVLFAVFYDPPLGASLLKVAGVTPENAWLAALFIVTGLSPILPGFAHVERAVREAMHTWAVVPGKAHQMANDIASPSTSYILDERHIEEVVLPRVRSFLTPEDFVTGNAASPATKWARLNYLLYKFAPPAEEGLVAKKFKSPYTIRFQEDFVALRRQFEEFARRNGASLRVRPNSPAAVALAEKMDQMLHRLYVLMSCGAFGSTRSWEGAVQYLKRRYGLVVGNLQAGTFPTGPVFDALAAVGITVLLGSFLYAEFVPGARGQVNPLVWALSALATHGLAVLAAWMVFQLSKRHHEASFHGGARPTFSREWLAVVVVVSFTLALLPTWLGSLHYVLTAPNPRSPSISAAGYAFELSWAWAFLGVVTALAAYFHLERTANNPVTWRTRFVSAVAQGLINMMLAILIVLSQKPAVVPFASVGQMFAIPVVQLVFLLTALIGLTLGFFLPTALYRHGRDRRGGATRYRIVQGAGLDRGAIVVLTFGGQQLEGELVEISMTGCVVRVSRKAAQYLLGRNGTVTLDGGVTVPAFTAREVRPGIAESVEIAFGLSSERRFYCLPKATRERIQAFLSRLGTGRAAANSAAV